MNRQGKKERANLDWIGGSIVQIWIGLVDRSILVLSMNIFIVFLFEQLFDSISMPPCKSVHPFYEHIPAHYRGDLSKHARPFSAGGVDPRKDPPYFYMV